MTPSDWLHAFGLVALTVASVLQSFAIRRLLLRTHGLGVHISIDSQDGACPLCGRPFPLHPVAPVPPPDSPPAKTPVRFVDRRPR